MFTVMQYSLAAQFSLKGGIGKKCNAQNLFSEARGKVYVLLSPKKWIKKM